MPGYLWLKLVHVLIAISALGAGFGVGLILQFFGDHPTHGPYVLRAARRLQHFVVMPGYVLMLATGMWLGHLAGLLDEHWTEAAMNIWGIGAVFMGLSLVALRKRIRLLESEGVESAAYRRASRWSRVFGSAAGLVILTIVYFMVLKPSA